MRIWVIVGCGRVCLFVCVCVCVCVVCVCVQHIKECVHVARKLTAGRVTSVFTFCPSRMQLHFGAWAPWPCSRGTPTKAPAASS
jgi:hypothetical protein